MSLKAIRLPPVSPCTKVIFAPNAAAPFESTTVPCRTDVELADKFAQKPSAFAAKQIIKLTERILMQGKLDLTKRTGQDPSSCLATRRGTRNNVLERIRQQFSGDTERRNTTWEGKKKRKWTEKFPPMKKVEKNKD